MELHKSHPDQTEKIPVDDAAWQPEVLEGAQEAADLPSDFDLEEVWYWFHSRLKALGHLGHDDARLATLLNWNDVTVGDALHAARLHIDRQSSEGAARQTHLEYLTADYMARQVLEEESIPSPELHPA